MFALRSWHFLDVGLLTKGPSNKGTSMITIILQQRSKRIWMSFFLLSSGGFLLQLSFSACNCVWKFLLTIL